MWMGAYHSDLDQVCPNRKNFEESSLLTGDDMFKGVLSPPPTNSPTTSRPTVIPSITPTLPPVPTLNPTAYPSTAPTTSHPTTTPSLVPSSVPSTSSVPSSVPSTNPTLVPTTSVAPTMGVTSAPSMSPSTSSAPTTSLFSIVEASLMISLGSADSALSDEDLGEFETVLDSIAASSIGSGRRLHEMRTNRALTAEIQTLFEVIEQEIIDGDLVIDAVLKIISKSDISDSASTFVNYVNDNPGVVVDALESNGISINDFAVELQDVLDGSTENPSSVPSLAPSLNPSSSPSSKPSVFVDDCVDDESYRYQLNAKKGCGWVAKNKARCTLTDSQGAVSDFCKITCDSCPKPTPSPTGSPTTPPTVSSAPSVTGGACEDDESYRWKDKDKFSCEFFSKRPAAYCGKADANGGTIADYCKETCGLCDSEPNTDSPTQSPTAGDGGGGGDCVDDPNYDFKGNKCPELGGKCNKADVAEFCKKTCGECTSPTAAPTEFDDSIEWTIKSYDDRDANVGDTVTFKWSFSHNVYIHPSGDCTEDGSIVVGLESPASYTFKEEDAGKTITFACQKEGHCLGGQIIHFNVGGGDDCGDDPDFRFKEKACPNLGGKCNKAEVMEACKETCGQCDGGGGGDGTCEDDPDFFFKKTDCAGNAGRCDRGAVLESCPKTCGVCTRAAKTKKNAKKTKLFN